MHPKYVIRREKNIKETNKNDYKKKKDDDEEKRGSATAWNVFV